MDTRTDLEMMKDPYSWPHLVLPLKKPGAGGGWPEFGVMLAKDTNVYLCNMFDLPRDMSSCPKKEYTSLEEVVADGWVID